MGTPPVTKLDDALNGVRKLGLDTSPFIYFVEANPVYLSVAREVFRRIENDRFEACSSTITLVEVLAQPLRLSNHILAN